jgi:putative transposase
MERTIVVQLNPTPEQARILKKTLEQHTACFNAVAHEGFTTSCSNGVELHKRTYYPLRAEYPALPAQLVCAARVKATEAVKSALTWKGKQEKAYPKKVERAKKQGKPIPAFKPVSTPHSEMACIRYDQRSSWVKWDANMCSLATVNGRVELPFTVPAHLTRYVGNKTCSADLCFHKGRYSLHIVVSLPEPMITSSAEVVGVDLGLNRPAVTSNRHFLGEKRWKEQERRTFRLKRKLQAKGTRSAKRHLKKLSGKQFRRRKDHDHVLSKRIVQHTPTGATIVLENLKNIRETSKMGRGKDASKKRDIKRRLHSWSFAQLYAFVEYKAEAHGIRVVKTDPRHTSQECSRCHFQHRSNRRSQSLFKCRECGYTLNADLNAAYNIRDKYCLAQDGRPVLSGPTCQPAHRVGSSESDASPLLSSGGC